MVMKTKPDKEKAPQAVKAVKGTRASGMLVEVGKTYDVGEGEGKISPKDALTLLKMKKVVPVGAPEKKDPQKKDPSKK
jgi:hypothetical protein